MNSDKATMKETMSELMNNEDFKNMCDKAFANLTDEEIESFLGVILKIKHNFD